MNQIWPNKRRDGGETGRNAGENGGPREQLRFVRALACGRAAKKSVRATEAERRRDAERGRKRDGGQTFAPSRAANSRSKLKLGGGQKGWQEGTFRTFFVC